eukprot:gene9737-biopygen6771
MAGRGFCFLFGPADCPIIQHRLVDDDRGPHKMEPNGRSPSPTWAAWPEHNSGIHRRPGREGSASIQGGRALAGLRDERADLGERPPIPGGAARALPEKGRLASTLNGRLASTLWNLDTLTVKMPGWPAQVHEESRRGGCPPHARPAWRAAGAPSSDTHARTLHSLARTPAPTLTPARFHARALARSRAIHARAPVGLVGFTMHSSWPEVSSAGDARRRAAARGGPLPPGGARWRPVAPGGA